jgi:CheY-like chemotaxis protein
MDPQRLPNIFEPFEQEGRAPGHGGLGLGLHICRAVVTTHGGTISAHSDGPGCGATFTVRLPLDDVAEEPTASPEGSHATETAKAFLPAKEGVEATGVRRLRVLLVEDDPDSAELMRLLLEQKGYEVSVANRFERALAAVAESQPDVLISDFGLPDGDGLDIPRELESRGLKTPAIALSGYGMDADIERSRAAGFAAHVVKPLKDIEQLVEAIGKLHLTSRLR